MDFSARWRSLRTKASLPNFLLTVVVIGIIIFALIDAVRHGYLSAFTAYLLAAFIPSVILHEVSHGVVALWRGDDTAKVAHRLTLNPLRHVDLFGSIVMPIVFLITTGVPFGWAKPVPVSVNRLRHPRNDAVLVGLAGPVTNIILAAIVGVALHFVIVTGHAFDANGNFTVAANILIALGIANIVLAAFNLLPIPPLDGSSILERFIPSRLIGQYYQIRFFLGIILIFLVLTRRGILNTYLGDVESWYFNLVGG